MPMVSDEDAGSQLTKATKNSNLLEMSRLIETYPNCVHYTNNYGCTALHYACMANRVEPAKMLVLNGADLYLFNKGILGHPTHRSPKMAIEMSNAALSKQLALLKEQMDPPDCMETTCGCYPQSNSQKATVGGGLFNCMDDPARFACSLFLPCCAVGQTVANTMTTGLDEQGRPEFGSEFGVTNNQIRNTTACYYMCCCCCYSCFPENPSLGRTEEDRRGRGCYEFGCYNEPRPSCVVHALKWFLCHPCYVSQLFRASKLALDVRMKEFDNVHGGAPDCKKMER